VYVVIGVFARDYRLCRSLRDVSEMTGLSYYLLRERFRDNGEWVDFDWRVYRVDI
jgi:hypothetical protein